VHDALYMDAHVRILQAFDASPTPVTMGKERKRLPRHLRQAGIVRTTGDGHDGTRTRDRSGGSHKIDAARTIVARDP
jgi:hypothetical protein